MNSGTIGWGWKKPDRLEAFETQHAEALDIPASATLGILAVTAVRDIEAPLLVQSHVCHETS
jgi:hypothetical protein